MNPRHARSSIDHRGARWLIAVGLLVVSAAMPGTAHAYWSGQGSGSGTATVATIPDLEVTAASPQYSDRVHVAWTSPSVPSGMAVEGYRVVRFVGGATVDACGSSASSLLPPGTLSCTDTALPDGSFDYAVTAAVGSWTASGETAQPVVVAADRTGPSIRLQGVNEVNALLDRRAGSDLLFIRSNAAGGGSLRIDAELTDNEVGPASAQFPAVTTSGWVHAAENVTSGTGSEPTITYRSSPFTFGQGAGTPAGIVVTGLDDRDNASTKTITVVSDTTGPTGGALRVNGVDASGAGSSSNSSGAFSVDAMTAFSEPATVSASGADSTVLVRESASLAGGTCGAFAGSVVVSGPIPIAQSGLSDGCYRYTLTGSDLVGNTTTLRTTVKVDTSAPTGGAARANGVDAVPGGSDSWDRTGAWSVSRTDYVDGESGIVSSVLTRSTTTLTGGSCGGSWSTTTLTGSPAESGVTTGCVRYTLTGTNGTGLTSEITTTVKVDRVVPVSGALTVNGTAASAAGTTSSSASSTVTVSVLNDFTDANAGMASNVLVRTFAPMAAGVCGTFESTSTSVSGPAPVTLVGLADGCHRFTWTGTDQAGNSSSISTIVRLDSSAPVGAVLTVGGVAGTAAGTVAYASVNPVAVAWTKFVDPESGMGSALVQRTTSSQLINGDCGTSYASPSTLSNTLTPTTGTSSQTLSTTTLRCYKYVLTGTNAFGTASSVQVILVFDTSVPTSTGNLTVNGSNGTTAGVSNTSTTGTFSVTALRVYSDAQSGMQSSVLTRTWAPVSGSVCGTYDSATTVTLADPVPIVQTTLPVGCYRYAQTGTNMVGGSVTYSVAVRVDTTAPVNGSLTANGTAATTGAGSTSYNTTGGWAVDQVNFTDPESTVTNTLTRATVATITNGTCGTFGTAVTVTNLTAESAIAGGCIRYVFTGRNSLNLTAPVLTTVVKVDTTAPTGGVLTVNGANATVVGSTSTSATGTFNISARTHFSDGNSGMAATTLTRTNGPTCDALDPGTAQVITANAPIAQTVTPGCYRYVLSGTNGAGTTSTIMTTVTVGP